MADKEPVVLMSWRAILVALKPNFKGLFWPYFGVSLLLTSASATAIFEPILYGRIIDAVVASIAASTTRGVFLVVLPIFLLWIATSLGGSMIRNFARYLGFHFGYTIYERFLSDATMRIFKWDPAKFQNIATGSIGKQVDRAAGRLFSIATMNLRDIFPLFVTIIGFFIVGSRLSLRMTLVVFTIMPIFFVIAQGGNYWMTRANAKLDGAWDDYFALFHDYVGQVGVVQAFAQENRAHKKLQNLHLAVIGRQRRVDVLGTAFDFVMATARFGARAVVLASGVWWISQGQLTLGTLVAFISMLGLILDPLDRLFSNIMRSLQEGRTAMSRIMPKLLESNELIEAVKGKAFPAEPPTIALDHVRYRYADHAAMALKNVSLTVPAGKSLALVGHSGSGKSTLAKLLNRFLDPNKGHIYVNGIDLRDFTLASVRSSVGLVSQETQLFNSSIFENVRFAKPSATRAEVAAACKLAQAHDYISRLKDGYDTLVGERGVKLSGGERQRLAIARVLLADAPVLVLDESTSALDSETEADLQKALRLAMKGRTTFVIAHRLSTVYMCDQIAVLEKGALVQLGTHDELVGEADGLYSRLWKLQSGGFLPE